MSRLDASNRAVDGQKVATPTSRLDSREPVYSPLKQNEVRFIEILPSDAEETPVSCLLKAVELGPNVRYAALSYVWGDPKVTCDIVVNGVVMPVTTSLESALRQFRKTGFPEDAEFGRVTQLWVDAICINQKDIQERSQQVTRMASIYRNANYVFSWLGLPDRYLHNLAFQIIRKFCHYICHYIWRRRESKVEYVLSELAKIGFEWLVANLGPFLPGGIRHRSEQWEALTDLGSSIYWSRMWIIQEMALADDPSIHLFICGTESISRRALDLFGDFLQACRQSSHQCLEIHNHNEYVIRGFLSNIAALKLPTEDNLRALDSCRGWLVKHICTASLKASATDPRDFVYAMLSLAENNIQPDYTKSVKAVYLDAVLSDGITRCLEWCLYFSGRGYGHENYYDVPSWIPDFSKIEPGISFPTSKCIPLPGNVQLKTPEVTQEGNIWIQGAFYDSVQSVYSTPPKEVDGLEGAVKYIQNICIEYLTDLKTLENKESDDAFWWDIRTKPLQALMEVLGSVWELDQVSLPDFGKCDIPPPLKYFWRKVIEDKPLTEEENTRVQRRLGISRDILFFVLLRAYAGQNTTGFIKALYEAGEGIDEISGLPWVPVAHRVSHRTLFKTTKGHLGIGPPNLQPGDALCALDRSTTSSLLRKTEPYWEHVGACYIAKSSSIDLTGMVERGELQIEAFEIH
ncbi:heterokaryon incompatibility protein-domain-containing protein [Daldinia bambusicola]|nr:heterokaryon incompatibility protein-domain-containing protein [Daldinia bambusicola]